MVFRTVSCGFVGNLDWRDVGPGVRVDLCSVDSDVDSVDSDIGLISSSDVLAEIVEHSFGDVNDIGVVISDPIRERDFKRRVGVHVPD